MVTAVTGYTTTDGVFYNDELDAKLHEYRKLIERAISPKWSLENRASLDYELVLTFIERNAEAVNKYTEHYLEKYPKVLAETEEEDDAPRLPLED